MELLYREAESVLISIGVVIWFYFLLSLWLFLQSLLHLRRSRLCGLQKPHVTDCPRCCAE